jgi:hypothetical protein
MSNDNKSFGRNEFREVASWIGGLTINFTDCNGKRLTDDEAAKAFGQWDPELGKKVGAMLTAQALACASASAAARMRLTSSCVRNGLVFMVLKMELVGTRLWSFGVPRIRRIPVSLDRRLP